MQQTTQSATGRRKEAVARAILRPGKGTIMVNGKEALAYLNRETLVTAVRSPLVVTEYDGQVDVEVNARGGGKSGQAGAIKLAIARALLRHNPEVREVLRDNGLLTRDDRAVERKKYGRPKARKRFQYSKR